MSEISSRLDRIPFSRLHLRLLAMGGLGYMFDALDISVIAFVLPLLKTQWGLSSAQIGLLAAGSQIGGLCGAALAGWLGDRFGRRAVMMWALAIFSLASLGCAIAPGWLWFLALRIVTGVGTSAETAIVSPYLAEFAGPAFRGRFLGSLMGFFSFGFLLATGLSLAVIPLSTNGWRYAFALTGAPVVMLLWWRRALPESPRWLESKGRFAEASAVMLRIEQEYERRGSALSPVPVGAWDATPVANTLGASGSSLRTNLMMLVNWFAMGFCYYAFITWIPSLLIDRGEALMRSFSFTLVIFIAQVPGYFSAAWLNDIIGRRAVIAIYMLGAAVSACGAALGTTPAFVVAALVLLSFSMNGAYAGLYPYTAEIYSTAVRARALGSLLAVSRLASIVSPIAVGFIYPVYGFAGVFGPSAAILLAGAGLTLLLGTHTRDRPLEWVVQQTEAQTVESSAPPMLKSRQPGSS